MFIRPMLLQEIDKPFNNKHWITELKFDGIRLILDRSEGIHLYSRQNHEWTAALPHLQNLDLPPGTVLDGELILPNDIGQPDFEALMGQLLSGRTICRAVYCVFDILKYAGETTLSLPLLKRKKLLKSVLSQNESIIQVPFILGNALEYFNAIKQKNLEGIVLKKLDSHYYPGKRSNEWLKVVNYQYINVLITGFRKNRFGLFLSFHDGSPAGILEFMASRDKKTFFNLASPIEEKNSTVLIQPIQCQVKYRNLTKHQRLRLPVFTQFL